MNAYRYEDPITAFVSAGYANLIHTHLGPDAYSYSFDAEWGYLDHALATSTLAAQVAGVTEWHMNADEPMVLDYNTEFKSAGQVTSFYSTDPFRISDHDPLIVGLNLAVNGAPTVDAGGPYTVTTGFTTTLTAVANDPNGDPLTVAWTSTTTAPTRHPAPRSPSRSSRSRPERTRSGSGRPRPLPAACRRPTPQR